MNKQLGPTAENAELLATYIIFLPFIRMFPKLIFAPAPQYLFDIYSKEQIINMFDILSNLIKDILTKYDFIYNDNTIDTVHVLTMLASSSRYEYEMFIKRMLDIKSQGGGTRKNTNTTDMYNLLFKSELRGGRGTSPSGTPDSTPVASLDTSPAAPLAAPPVSTLAVSQGPRSDSSVDLVRTPPRVHNALTAFTPENRGRFNALPTSDQSSILALVSGGFGQGISASNALAVLEQRDIIATSGINRAIYFSNLLNKLGIIDDIQDNIESLNTDKGRKQLERHLQILIRDIITRLQTSDKSKIMLNKNNTQTIHSVLKRKEEIDASLTQTFGGILFFCAAGLTSGFYSYTRLTSYTSKLAKRFPPNIPKISIITIDGVSLSLQREDGAVLVLKDNLPAIWKRGTVEVKKKHRTTSLGYRKHVEVNIYEQGVRKAAGRLLDEKVGELQNALAAGPGACGTTHKVSQWGFNPFASRVPAITDIDTCTLYKDQLNQYNDSNIVLGIDVASLGPNATSMWEEIDFEYVPPSELRAGTNYSVTNNAFVNLAPGSDGLVFDPLTGETMRQWRLGEYDCSLKGFPYGEVGGRVMAGALVGSYGGTPGMIFGGISGAASSPGLRTCGFVAGTQIANAAVKAADVSVALGAGACSAGFSFLALTLCCSRRKFTVPAYNLKKAEAIIQSQLTSKLTNKYITSISSMLQNRHLRVTIFLETAQAIHTALHPDIKELLQLAEKEIKSPTSQLTFLEKILLGRTMTFKASATVAAAEPPVNSSVNTGAAEARRVSNFRKAVTKIIPTHSKFNKYRNLEGLIETIIESATSQILQKFIQRIDNVDKEGKREEFEGLKEDIRRFESGGLLIADAERKYQADSLPNFLELRAKYKDKNFDDIYDDTTNSRLHEEIMHALSTNAELKQLLKDVFKADLGFEPVSVIPKFLKFWGGTNKEINSLNLPEGYGSSLVLTNIILLSFNHMNNGYRYIIPSTHTVMSMYNIQNKIKNTRNNRNSYRNTMKRRTTV